MAREIIIAGTNLLSSLSDEWGGVNNTGAAITKYGTTVPNGYKWGVNFAEVERFIKSLFGTNASQITGLQSLINSVGASKIGCLRTYETPSEETHLIGFATLADYEAWFADHSAVTPIADIVLPQGGGGGSSSAYTVTLEGTAPSALQGSNDFTVRLRVLSKYNETDVPEQVTLTIQSRTGTGSWVTRGTMRIPSNTWTNVSMQGLLPSGNLEVRISAEGNYASTPFPWSFNVNIVNLTLASANTFYRPFESGASTMRLSYNLTGNIDKTLELEFDGEVTRNADPSTASYPDSPFTFELDEAEELLTPGAHILRAQLYAKADDTVATDWVVNEYLVSGVQTPVVAVNNAADSVSNWSDVHFLDWALCLPDGVDTLDVVFRLTARNSNTTLVSWPFNGSAAGTEYQFITQLAVDNLANGRSNMTLHIEDSEGNALHDPILLVVVNDASFAPVSGPSFVLSPAVRSNAEEHPDTIVNTAAPLVPVSSTFEGFDWSTDGWKEVTYLGATVKVLRIPAGRLLTIGHNPFANFTGGDNAGISAAWELDFAVDNVTDEEEVLLSIGRETNDGWRGFVLWPMRAALLTNKQQVEADQDVSWAESRRFHLAVTVQHNAYAADAQNQIPATHLIRIYLNGVLEREIAYDTDEALTPSGVSLVIGGTSADIDIYGMRSYNKSLSSVEVMQDYKASMSTVAEKIAFAAANDILDDNNRIDWDKCLGKYNVIGHKGRLLNYDTGNDEARIESLEIHIVGDDEHSGILTNLDNKGQGTTAMGYYYWNQQYKIRTGNDHPTQFLDFEGNVKDENFSGYKIAGTEYPATKLVGKVNFASSMQSHKLGLTRAYTDIFKQLFASQLNATPPTGPKQLELFPDARLAVYEKPFLFFVWNEAESRWDFQNLMTFGAGKGDKPTFGFNKNTTPHMLMVEGANNEAPLAFFNIPWDDKITYNAEKETWDYPNIGDKNINFGFGKTSNDIPSDAEALASIRRFFNFVYMHSQNIEPYNGTLRQLKQDATMGGNALVPQVWLTSNHKLYRYCTKANSGAGDWIDAGIDGAEVDLAAEYEAYTGNALDTSLGADEKNDLFKTARLNHFKTYANDIFAVDDAIYHYCFIKFFAGTDNRAKNTYYYTDERTTVITDPFTGEQVNHHRVRWMQDDLDTVIKTNNVGQNRKPYWVEEHTKNNGVNYWAAEDSVFNCLLEYAWDKDNSDEAYNLQRTMRDMLSAMARISGSVLNFLEEYLLAVQRTEFPAIAYNEQARVVYETAYRWWTSTADDTYTHGTNPLSQSCGSQLWSEYQWLVDRIMFISSWCQYGEFASTEGAPGGTNWRSRRSEVGAGTTLRLTPAKWLYPRVAQGGVNAAPTALTAPNSVYAAPTMSPMSDTTLYIRGINYLAKLGDMDVWQHLTDQPTFSFTGKRLQEVTVNPNGNNSPVKWTSQRVVVTATNIKRYIQRNTPLLKGELDLSACVRLEEINVEGTSLTEVKLPPTGSLTSLTLPATIEKLSLVNMTNLSTLIIGTTQNPISVDALEELTVNNSPAADTLSIVRAAISHLTKLNVSGVDWRVSGASGLALVNALAAMGSNCRISGTITLTGVTPSFEDKAAWIQAWGDVDNGTDGLTIVYTQSTIENVRIITSKYLESTGDHQLAINSSGNNFTGVQWSISQNGFATINSRTGVVTVWQLDSEANEPYADVTVNVTRVDGTVLTDTKRFYFCEHICREGDYVYADGTFSDELLSYKTVVALCFYINPNNPADRLAVSRGNVITDQWGLYNNSSDGVANVALDDGSSYSCYDTPVINITSNGNGDIDNLSSMASFAGYNRDTAVGDVGFVELTEDIGPFRIGDFIHVGQYKTLQIIRHRNKVLNGVTLSGVDLTQPIEANANQTEREVLTNRIATIVAAKGNKYRQFYWPAASYCYAYQPTYQLQPGEVLADKFKAHNWWLPTLGELGMVYWQQVKGGIFAAAQSNSRYTNLTNDYHWTSTEYSATIACGLHGGNGQVIYIGNKNTSRACRAVVAF